MNLFEKNGIIQAVEKAMRQKKIPENGLAVVYKTLDTIRAMINQA